VALPGRVPIFLDEPTSRAIGDNEGASMKRMTGTLSLAVALLLAAATGLLAQPAATGNIYGKVTDESGADLPGALVTLSGAFGSRATTSTHQGDFRFLGVPHGPISSPSPWRASRP
jgi:hypothetical protein